MGVTIYNNGGFYSKDWKNDKKHQATITREGRPLNRVYAQATYQLQSSVKRVHRIMDTITRSKNL